MLQKQTKLINLAFKNFNKWLYNLFSTISFHTMFQLKKRKTPLLAACFFHFAAHSIFSSQKAFPTQHLCKIKYLSYKPQTEYISSLSKFSISPLLLLEVIPFSSEYIKYANLISLHHYTEYSLREGSISNSFFSFCL